MGHSFDKFPPKDAPPTDTVSVSSEFSDKALVDQGLGHRLKVEAISFSHLAPFGGLKHIDKRPLPKRGFSHIGERHIGKSLEYLQQRVLSGQTLYATSFPDSRSAELCLSLALDAHADSILEFVQDSESPGAQLQVRFSESVGYGVIRDDINERLETRFVQVWIAKNPPGSERPYEVITAFPDMTKTTGNRYVPWEPKSSTGTTLGERDKKQKREAEESESQLYSAYTPKTKSKDADLKGRAYVEPAAVSISIAGPEETRELFYGSMSLPGGVLVHPGSASMRIKSVVLSKSKPGVLKVNGRRFDSGLSYEEVYHLYQISQRTEKVAATSVSNVEGTSSANIVGATLRLLDRKLGELFLDRSELDSTRELAALASLSDRELAAKLERELSDIKSVVCIEVLAPELAKERRRWVCRSVSMKVHFIPFCGSVNSPKFAIDEDRIPYLFPREAIIVDDLQKSPETLFEHSNLFARVQRYATVLSIFNGAKANEVKIKNLFAYDRAFRNRGTFIKSVEISQSRPMVRNVDMKLIEESVRGSQDQRKFLRAVTEAFLYIGSRDPFQVLKLEAIVRDEMLNRVPSSSSRESMEIGYLRSFAASLALGCQSIRGRGFRGSAKHEVSFEAGVSELSSLVGNQKLENLFEILYRMPLHASSNRREFEFSPSAIEFAQLIGRLSDLGYGWQVATLLLDRLVELSSQHSFDLITVDSGVKAALGMCLSRSRYFEESRWGETACFDVSSMDAREIRRVFFELKLMPFCGSNCEIDTVRLACSEYRMAVLRSSGKPEELGIDIFEMEMISRFCQEVKVLKEALGRSFDKQRSEERTFPYRRFLQRMTGIRRLDKEISILMTFGLINEQQASDVKQRYRNLVRVCVEGVRLLKVNERDPLEILGRTSFVLFRALGIKFSNIGTIARSLNTNTIDCDASCHIYADVLAEFGHSCRFVLSPGHCHLAVRNFYFEARGSEFLSLEEGRRRYGFMRVLEGNDAADAIGVCETLGEVVGEKSADDFVRARDAEIVNQHFSGKVPEDILYSRRRSRVGISIPQADFIIDQIYLALNIVADRPEVFESCYFALEAIVVKSGTEKSKIELARQRLAKVAWKSIEQGLVHSSVLRIMRSLRSYIALTEEQQQYFRELLALHNTSLIEDITDSYKARTGQEDLTDQDRSEILYRYSYGDNSNPVHFAKLLFGCKLALQALLAKGVCGAEKSVGEVDDFRNSPAQLALFNYTRLLQRAMEVPDREHVNCMSAWLSPMTSGPRAMAAYQLLWRHGRPGLARKWARSLIDVPTSLELYSPVDGIVALGLLGDSYTLQRFFQNWPPLIQRGYQKEVEKKIEQTMNPVTRFQILLALFFDLGHESADGGIFFLEQMAALGHIENDYVAYLKPLIVNDGISSRTVWQITDALKDLPARLAAKSMLLSNKKLVNYRSFAAYCFPELDYGPVFEALAARERGLYLDVLSLRDKTLPLATQCFAVPIWAGLAEAYALTGNLEDSISYAEMVRDQTLNAEDKPFVLEMEIALLIAQGELSIAEEMLGNISKKSWPGIYQYTLRRIIFERTRF